MDSALYQPFVDTLRALDGERRRRKHTVATLSVAGLIIAAWIAWFLLMPVSLHVSTALARLEADRQVHRVEVGVGGRVERVTAEVGQSVAAGDILFVLRSSRARLSLEQAAAEREGLVRQAAAVAGEIAAVEQALAASKATDEALVAEYRALSDQAEAAASMESEHAERFGEMHDRGVLATLDWDRQRVAAIRADSEARSRTMRVRRLTRERDERRSERRASRYRLQRDLERLQAEILAADAALARLRVQVEEHTIRSPVSGEVGELSDIRAGEYVSPGQHLASVVPGGPVKIVADFPPSHAMGRIRPGQAARMHLDAFPSSEYGVVRAVVSRVAREARYGYIRVEMELVPPPGTIPVEHGLPGSVEVDVEKVTPALMVLRAAGHRFGRPMGRGR